MKSVKENAILNVIKEFCAIVFPLITLPYVMRIIGTDGMGKYSFAASVTNYFVLIAALGINTYAIREGAPIRDDKSKLEKFGSELFSINLCSAALAYVLLGGLLLVNEKIRGYAPLILIQSVAIILAAIGAEWINSVYEDYLYITVRYIIIQCICLALTFLLVRDTGDLIRYTCIVVFAANGGFLVNAFYRRKYCRLRVTAKMRIKEHLSPLLALFVNTVAILIYVNSDITVLGFYYDDSTVGIYSFAGRIYNMIKGMIAAAIMAALPRVAYINTNDKEQYRGMVKKMFSMLAMFALPIIAGLASLSSEIIRVVGGEEFVPGSSSLVVLSCAMVFALGGGIVSNCILVVNKCENKCMISTLITALVNVLLNLVLIPRYGIMAAAFTTVIAETMNMIIQMVYASKFVDFRKIPDAEWFVYIGEAVLVIIICRCLPLLIPENSIAGSALIIVVSMAVSIGIYVFLLLITKNEQFAALLALFKRRFLHRE